MSGARETPVARRPRRRHAVRLVVLLLGAVAANAVVTGVVWWRLPHASLDDRRSVDPDAAPSLFDGLDRQPEERFVERWRSWGITVVEASGRWDLHTLDSERPDWRPRGMITVPDVATRASLGWPWRCVYFERLREGYRSAIVADRVARDARIGRRRRMSAQGGEGPVWLGHPPRLWGAVVPVGVHAGGMIANVLFYAIGLWLVAFSIRAAHRAIRRWRGRCPTCGYPRGVSPICTECGEKLFTRAPPPEAPASS